MEKKWRYVLGVGGLVLVVFGAAFLPLPYLGMLTFPMILVGAIASIFGFSVAYHPAESRSKLRFLGILLIALGAVVVLFGAILTPSVFFANPNAHLPEGFTLTARLDREHSIFLPILWLAGPGLVTVGIGLLTASKTSILMWTFTALVAVFPLVMLAFLILSRSGWPLTD